MTSLGGFLPSFLFPVSAVGVRALLPQERQGVQLVQQSHHPGSRLRFDWHLQLCHPVEGPFPHQVELESHRAVAGAQAGCRLPRFHFVLPLRLLDARHNRLVTYITATIKRWRCQHHSWHENSLLFSLDDLIKAGITLAESVVVVNKEFSNSAEEDTLSDCNTIVSVQTMFKYIRHPTTTEWHFNICSVGFSRASRRLRNWASRPTCASCNSGLTTSTHCICRAWRKRRRSADLIYPTCSGCRLPPEAFSRPAC